MKKKIILAITTAMTLGILAGCATVSPEEGSVKEAQSETAVDEQEEYVSFCDLDPEVAQQKYEQDLIDMKFQNFYLDIVVGKSQLEGDIKDWQKRGDLKMLRMILDYRRLTSSDGVEAVALNDGRTAYFMSELNIPTFDTEEHRAGYDKLREYHLQLWGIPLNLNEDIEEAKKEGGRLNTGMVQFEISSLESLIELAKKQNYTEIDFDTVSTIAFVDWFCDKFQGGYYYDKYYSPAWWDEPYIGEILKESNLDLSKRYVLTTNGLQYEDYEMYFVEIDENGNPVDKTIELQERADQPFVEYPKAIDSTLSLFE